MARITFEVSQEQHAHIKMMAASKGISIRDYFLMQIEKSLPATEGKRPSWRTRKTLEKADKHQNLHFTTNAQEFYRELRLTRYLESKQDGELPKNVKAFEIDKNRTAA